jgi:hypothetical protein
LIDRMKGEPCYFYAGGFWHATRRQSSSRCSAARR